MKVTFFCFAIYTFGWNQVTDIWNMLMDVSGVNLQSSVMDISQPYQPVFGESVKNLNGKEIEIKGYMIATGDNDGRYFILSRFPYAQCFFCGNAGPETVIEVEMKQSVSFTDKLITIYGILELNESDPFRLLYKLKEGELKK